MYISVAMRIMYNAIFTLQTEAMVGAGFERDKLSNQAGFINPLKALPKSLQYESLYKLKSYMNGELKEKIQKVSNQGNKHVRDKSCLERFLEFPPPELLQGGQDDIIFYKGIFIYFN